MQSGILVKVKGGQKLQEILLCLTSGCFSLRGKVSLSKRTLSALFFKALELRLKLGP